MNVAPLLTGDVPAAGKHGAACTDGQRPAADGRAAAVSVAAVGQQQRARAALAQPLSSQQGGADRGRLVVYNDRGRARADGERQLIGGNAVVVQRPVVARGGVAEFQGADRPRRIEMHGIVGRDVELAEIGGRAAAAGNVSK